jgi:NAD(P)H-hydrate epimerase
MGEMARLLRCETSMIADKRLLVAEQYAMQYGITVVLKGAGTIVASHNSVAVNHTGNAGMSVGGSGDVLAGMIGAVIAQGCGVFDGTDVQAMLPQGSWAWRHCSREISSAVCPMPSVC